RGPLARVLPLVACRLGGLSPSRAATSAGARGRGEPPGPPANSPRRGTAGPTAWLGSVPGWARDRRACKPPEAVREPGDPEGIRLDPDREDGRERRGDRGGGAIAAPGLAEQRCEQADAPRDEEEHACDPRLGAELGVVR